MTVSWACAMTSPMSARLLLAKPLTELMAEAEALTIETHGPVVTYSPKVFIPLTRLCRDVCHYCTFATTPRTAGAPFMSISDVVSLALRGQAAGCREALFTLGDQPETRYASARNWLREMGHRSTLSYLGEAAAAVVRETSLLPHLNPGVMSQADMTALRPHAVSMGIMLESSSERLCAPGGPHYGSPDKAPAVRLATIEAAGRARIPITTGLLIGIGETRGERLEALQAIADLDSQYGHIQEVIIQNFAPKPGTRMASHPPAPLEEQLWTIAVARLVLRADISIQAPPNLRPGALDRLIGAGVNDWGGVSPVTLDHVNPEAPWPNIERLRVETESAGRVLRQRLAIGPRYARAPQTWVDETLQPRVLREVDARGLVHETPWRAGRGDKAPGLSFGMLNRVRDEVRKTVSRLQQSKGARADRIAALLEADGADGAYVLAAADELRADLVGEVVTYVSNRNINYTNICLHKCGFCAFSKGATSSARGPAYILDLEEIGRRAAEAQALGASEVCLQGGIHPEYNAATYLAIVRAVRTAAPGLHIHAFSPLEISHGAASSGLSLRDYLLALKEEGLSSLPGTAAEILVDEVRRIICPDKLSADAWLEVMRAAHEAGMRSSDTMMFGHVDTTLHWARHLLALRALQEETGGFTEFVPLPFVHMQTPIWRKGRARSGPSFRETVMVHALARLVLNPGIANIQTSWVKMGPDGAAACLAAGANDLGGVLMNESITRAAGGMMGQSLHPDAMLAIANAAGRLLRRRTTLYGVAAARPAEAELGVAD